MLSPTVRGNAITFVRSVIAKAACVGKSDAVAYARNTYGDRVAHLIKAPVDAQDIFDGDSSGTPNLASPEATAFFDAVAQESVVGRLNLASVPANVRVILMTGAATAYWVGRSQPKPLSYLNFDGDRLLLNKVATVLVRTIELMRFADPATEGKFAAELIRACAEEIDRSFLDPDNSGVEDEQPASVTDGVSPIPSSGDAAADVAALVASFTGDLLSASFVTDPITASQLALVRDVGGSPIFPDAGVRGGSLIGLPLLVSRASPRDSGGGILTLVDGSGVAFAGGGVRTEVSQEASVQMEDAPSMPAQMVSLFQTNSVAILAEVGVVWQVVRPGAVAFLDDVDYNVAVPS